MSFDHFRQYTQARIGLGNVGAGLPTKAWLDFSYQHAAAVDAIRAPWDIDQSAQALKAIGLNTQLLQSDVSNREEYLLRTDLGRRLNEASKKSVNHGIKSTGQTLMLIASNGLSSFAVANHLTPFLAVLSAELRASNIALTSNCVFLIPDARVAITDDLGEQLKPELGIILIGERPGLSSPDSLALYLTHTPKQGRSDANRNCISNIRIHHGLSYEEAAFKAMFLIRASIERGLSGVNLKDESNLLTD